MSKTCEACGKTFYPVRDRADRVKCSRCVRLEVNRRSWHKNKKKWAELSSRCIITKPCSVCKKEVVREVPVTKIYDGQYVDPVLCGDECRKIRDRELARVRMARYRARRK